MNYRLLALDLDDTLLSDDLSVSMENKIALSKIKEAGIRIVICTGRAFASAEAYVDELGLSKERGYCICHNGAALYDTFTKNPILTIPISREDVNFIIGVAEKYDVDIQVYSDDQIFVKKITPRVKDYISTKVIKTNIVENLCTSVTGDITKILLNSEVTELKKIEYFIKDKLNEKTHMFYSKPQYLEFAYSTKGTMLMNLIDRLGISKEAVIAIGDGHNDIHMIKEVGLGVAVGNASPNVKEIANLVLESTNEQSAIAELLTKITPRLAAGACRSLG